MIAVVDLGGSNADLLLADASGRVLSSTVVPARALRQSSFLSDLLAAIRVSRLDLDRIAVTGGWTRALPPAIDGLPLQHIDELAAIGRGGLLSAGVERALVVSMGTGTAMVSASAQGFQHAIGLALGGGTLRGLGSRLLGTTEPAEIDALARGGNAARANLTIADIVGEGVGQLPGSAPAAYLARLAGEEAGAVAPADIAAALLGMIGQVTGHLAVLTARSLQQERLVLIGHMLDFRQVRDAAVAFGRSLPLGVIVPESPGTAVARGALAIALER